MEPLLHDDDVVLIDPGAAAAPGFVVVCRHPFKPIELVKYVSDVSADGYVTLVSPGGTDSGAFGRPGQSLVRGRVTYNLSRRAPVGRDASVVASG